MRSCWDFSVVGTGRAATSWLEPHPWGTGVASVGRGCVLEVMCEQRVTHVTILRFLASPTVHTGPWHYRQSVSHFLGKYYIQWKILNLAQKVYPDQGARELLSHRTPTHVLLASLPPQPALVGPWMEHREQQHPGSTVLHNWAIVSWRWHREARKLISAPGTRENCWCPLDINGPFFSRAFRKP